MIYPSVRLSAMFSSQRLLLLELLYKKDCKFGINKLHSLPSSTQGKHLKNIVILIKYEVQMENFSFFFKISNQGHKVCNIFIEKPVNSTYQFFKFY